MHSFIRTYSGQRVSLLDDSTHCFNLEDIARGLSGVNRFNGQTLFPYSVAEHSVHVASRLPPELQLLGLLHDASEAYLIDMPSPHKALLPDYRFYEEKTQERIYRRFGLDPDWVKTVYPAVKEKDVYMLCLEGNLLQKYNDFPEVEESKEAPNIVVGWDFFDMQKIFKGAYHRITRGEFLEPTTLTTMTKLKESHDLRN